MTATLNRRVSQLEAAAAPPADPDQCQQCGLRHARRLTLAIIRGVLRIAGGSPGDAVNVQPTPLCLCTCCTSDPRDRWFVRRSHGLPDEGNIA
jgi:hypothetical protein